MDSNMRYYAKLHYANINPGLLDPPSAGPNRSLKLPKRCRLLQKQPKIAKVAETPSCRNTNAFPTVYWCNLIYVCT